MHLCHTKEVDAGHSCEEEHHAEGTGCTRHDVQRRQHKHGGVELTEFELVVDPTFDAGGIFCRLFLVPDDHLVEVGVSVDVVHAFPALTLLVVGSSLALVVCLVDDVQFVLDHAVDGSDEEDDELHEEEEDEAPLHVLRL